MSRSRVLRLGTRASRLARWQAEWVTRLLARAGHQTALVEISTTGDELAEVPLSQLPGSDIFTRQLDQALLEDRIDLAVHSLKDVPTLLPPGIRLAAVTTREDPRDAIVGRGGPLRWSEVPPGVTIATCSIRRRAQLLRARPDLTLVDIRGNIETRLQKLDRSPDWSATILAVAGLARLDLSHRIGERLSAEVMLPAPGQGALTVATRDDDEAASAAARAAHDEAAARCVAAERAFLKHLDSGCQAPVAALATSLEGDEIELAGRVLQPDGRVTVEAALNRAVRSEAESATLGIALAELLLGRGAETILRSSGIAP